MPQKGQKTITISGEMAKIFDKAYKKAKIERPSLSFAGFIAELTLTHLENQESLSTNKYIQLIQVERDTVYLRDVRVKYNKIIEVNYNAGGGFCNTCNVHSCIHVGFAMGLPQVMRIQT